MTSSEPIFTPRASHRPMRVAAFMSGSGTNIRRLLEHTQDAYEIVFIFSDSQDESCQGQKIAREYGLPYFSHDIRRFHESKGIKLSVKTKEGMAARRAFDVLAKRLCEDFEVDIIALGGYMSFLTLNRGVNVHPADLSLTDPQGRRLFVGDNAVFDAIAAGRQELRSSTLWIDQGVDSGPLLMLSDPLPVELPAPLEELKQKPARLQEIADEHQERLKQRGDWVVFPLTLEMMGQGRLGLTPEGMVTLDGEAKPGGITPQDI
ncbi:MAG: formyltransferase family protein [Desulfarculaceae bacterium]